MAKLPRSGKLAVGLLIPLFLAAIYFTKTRSVWLGSATGTLIILGLVLRGRVRVAVLGGAVLAGALLVVAKSDALLGLQREGTVQDTRQSADMRKVFTYVSWRMFQDKPVWGVGFGQFSKSKLPYLTDHRTDLNLETIRAYVHHNTFLSILTETGLIGLAAFLAVLFGWARAGWQLVRNHQSPAWMKSHGLLLLGILGVALWQMVGHEITFTTLDQSLLHFVAGIGVGLTQMLARAGEPIPVSYSTPPWYRAPAIRAHR
jgi:O-antigen ligase